MAESVGEDDAKNDEGDDDADEDREEHGDAEAFFHVKVWADADEFLREGCSHGFDHC